MSFGLPKTSGTNRRRRAAGFSEINVTPLVDVMLVLLVVFMITAPMLTAGVPLDLPKTKAAKLNDQIEPIVISVDASGRSYLQETELQGEALIARLMVVTESNPDARIYVRGDANLSYGRIMEVMGDIAASGFTKVSLLAEMPQGFSKPSRASGAPTLIPASSTGMPGSTNTSPMNVTQGANPRPDLPTLQSIMPPQVKPQAASRVQVQRQQAKPAQVSKTTITPTQRQTQGRAQPQTQNKQISLQKRSSITASTARTPTSPEKSMGFLGQQTRPAPNRG